MQFFDQFNRIQLQAILVALVSPIHGDTIYVDLNGVAPNDGSTWAVAHTNLQDALAVASSGDQIWVAAGTYTPDEGIDQTPGDRTATFQLISGVAIYGGFSGGESLLSERDPATNKTVLSGDLDGDDISGGDNSDNAYHILTSYNTDATAILDGFIITAGHAHGVISEAKCGGGLFNSGGSPTLMNCIFSGNDALNFGGAIYNTNSSPNLINCIFSGNDGNLGGAIYNNSGSPVISNCNMSSNTAVSGGAIYNDSASPIISNCSMTGNTAIGGGAISNYYSTSAVINNCSFSGNTAEGYGGSIVNIASSTSLTNCSFRGNNASRGGAMHNDSLSPNLTNCSFSENNASWGGAIHNTSSIPNLTNCSFLENNALSGGAIHNFYSSSQSLTNCLFLGNTAVFYGGAIYNDESPLSLTNCSLLGNAANDYGGAIFHYYSSLTATNCSISGNSSDTGGGAIFSGESSPNLINCIVWNNRADGSTNTTQASVDTYLSTPTYSHCIIANSGGSAAWDSALGADNGDNIDADPLFVISVNPVNAPTIDGDLRLLYGSPAINMGDNSFNSEAFDLTGADRIQDSTIDLGAYEGGINATFELLHPALDPNIDSNGNGHSNYIDYAVGGDPLGPHNQSLYQSLNGNQLTLGYRDNASDVFVEFQKSVNLETWDEMTEGAGNDYIINSSTNSAGRTELTLDLLIAPPINPKIYFRQNFSQTAP